MKKLSFQLGIPIETINVNIDAVTDCMVKGLKFWQNGPATDCPFILCIGRCTELCGKVFLDIENVYEKCPFKARYTEAQLKALVEKILSEIGK